jgi:hypothetical protein
MYVNPTFRIKLSIKKKEIRKAKTYEESNKRKPNNSTTNGNRISTFVVWFLKAK